MLRIAQLKTLCVLAAGALMGFLAATDRLNPFPKAHAAPRSGDEVSRAAPAELRPAAEAMSCSDGVGKGALLALASSNAENRAGRAQASGKKPNIVFIMGDDVGWFNIGAYHQGIMAGRTPNLDRLAAEGMRFTDYYAEASCTAGRANFITGQLPIRTGLTTVGQAGATVGMPAQAPTIATALKSMGYATGQFGKNHLGDLNEFLPTVHGFDEFFGYLYHLDAMEDPFHRNYPPELKDTIGPAQHAALLGARTRTTRPSSRAGARSASRRSRTPARSTPERMETVDDEILEHAFKFIDKAKSDGKPFFVWLNPTRMHVVTHLSEKYDKLRTPENGWSIHEAGMAQLDDIVGAVMKKLKDEGLEDDTILVFTTDNGTENFTWPDGGQTPFAGGKGTVHGRGLPRAVHRALAGQGPRRQGRERDHLRPRLVPDVRGRGRQPRHRRRAEEGQDARRQDLQGPSRRLQPARPDHRQGPVEAARGLLLRRGHARRGAHRRLQVPLHRSARTAGWAARSSPTWPILVNLRLDPFERTGLTGSLNYLQLVRLRVLAVRLRAAGGGESSAQTAIEFPPMQKGASFNLEAVKEQILEGFEGALNGLPCYWEGDPPEADSRA